MTDNLVEKIEEKLMALLTDYENQRKELIELRKENQELKSEKTNYAKKLQGIISLLDVWNNDTNLTKETFRREEVA